MKKFCVYLREESTAWLTVSAEKYSIVSGDARFYVGTHCVAYVAFNGSTTAIVEQVEAAEVAV